MYKTIGKCPVCGHDLKDYNRAYGCSNWKESEGGCKFTIWKDTFGKSISEEELEQLLNGESIGPFELHTKDENYFDARIELDKSGAKLVFN